MRAFVVFGSWFGYWYASIRYAPFENVPHVGGWYFSRSSNHFVRCNGPLCGPLSFSAPGSATGTRRSGMRRSRTCRTSAAGTSREALTTSFVATARYAGLCRFRLLVRLLVLVDQVCAVRERAARRRLVLLG